MVRRRRRLAERTTTSKGSWGGWGRDDDNDGEDEDVVGHREEKVSTVVRGDSSYITSMSFKLIASPHRLERLEPFLWPLSV